MKNDKKIFWGLIFERKQGKIFSGSFSNRKREYNFCGGPFFRELLSKNPWKMFGRWAIISSGNDQKNFPSNCSRENEKARLFKGSFRKTTRKKFVFGQHFEEKENCFKIGENSDFSNFMHLFHFIQTSLQGAKVHLSLLLPSVPVSAFARIAFRRHMYIFHAYINALSLH